MADWFCPSLLVPEYERDLIAEWVEAQCPWPEGTKFKDPDTYHITLVYASVPHTGKLARQFMYEMGMDNWEHGVRVNGVQKFTGYNGRTPVVVTLHGALFLLAANHYLARARALGLNPSEHGPYKPHITVAEIPGEAEFDPFSLPLPGPDSALGFPLKFMTPRKPIELHSFYQDRKAGV